MFKTYLEIISQEKYKTLEQKNKKYLTSEKYKQRSEELLKKFFTDENGKIINTIIIPYISPHQQSLTQTDKEIIDYLNEHGYKCTEESYWLGYCFNDKNKKIPIIDVLKMIKQYNIEKLEQDKKNNLQYSTQYDKRIKAKQNFKENYLTYYQNFNKDKSKVIVFTWSPRSIASMSTDVGWESCLNLYNGRYHNKVFPTIEAGAFIAWLVQKGDEEILDNPQARILIKIYTTKNGKIFWYPSGNVYGTAPQNFYTKVKEFVIKKQEPYITDDDLENVYEFDKEQYLDKNDIEKLSPKNIFKEKYIPILEKKIKNITDPTTIDLDDLNDYLEDAIQTHIDITLIEKLLSYAKNKALNISKYFFNKMLIYAYICNNYDVVNVLLMDTSYRTIIDKDILFQYAIKVNNIKVVKELLKDGVDPSVNDNNAIDIALKKGYTDLVKVLLQDKRVKSTINKNIFLQKVVENGNIEIVKLLLQDKNVNPGYNNNLAIQIAATCGHTKIVKLLLQNKRVDPSDFNNYALYAAIEKEHIEIVKLLLQDPRVRSTININDVIQVAQIEGNTKITQFLQQYI